MDLYTIIKVAKEEDLAKQIGEEVYFDLVDYKNVTCFRVLKTTTFNFFKEEAAKTFRIPAALQRYWILANRQNKTCRPYRPLTRFEEEGTVGEFKVLNKAIKFEIKMFLEVERRPTPDSYPFAIPVALPEKGKDDILLFFKLYDPEKERLCYIGKLYVNCYHRPTKILKNLNRLAGNDPNEDIQLYEEIRFEPNVMCVPVNIRLTYLESELQNGDILCFQKASAIFNNKNNLRYPDVPSYLKYVHNRQVILSPSVQKPSETESDTEARTSKFISTNFKEIDDMIDENAVAAIDRVLSEGVTISLQYQPSFEGQVISEQDPNFPKLVLRELRDIAFKEDLVEKFKKGFIVKVDINAVKERIEANAKLFSSSQLEQVRVVVNVVNNIVRMFDKLEILKKQLDSTIKNNEQDNEALKNTREQILMLKASFPDQHTELESLDAQIADLKAKLGELECDRAKIIETQDQHRDKITSMNKEVRSIFHHLADGQIKLKSIENEIPETEADLESQEKAYSILRATPPF
ncbi:hypothetical protein RYX36_005726 [Vicia faba]